MCTQSSSLIGKKLSINSVSLVKTFGMHTLTRESQEVTLGLANPAELPSASVIVCTEIPHCSQLNSTISTLLTTLKFGVSVKSKVIATPFIVSSWLAHMLSSSPVSVGMMPSNRTLEVGSRQVCVHTSLLEQCPVAEDPFTDIAWKLHCDGWTKMQKGTTTCNISNLLPSWSSNLYSYK